MVGLDSSQTYLVSLSPCAYTAVTYFVIDLVSFGTAVAGIDIVAIGEVLIEARLNNLTHREVTKINYVHSIR